MNQKTEILDWALLLVWTPVVLYFLNRFLERKRLVSLGISVMAAGWVYPMWQEYAAPKWLGVFAGLFVLGCVFRVERSGR